MDYKRIYRDFIADRRERPPSKGEYVEVHHILPRCMGGDDGEENLIDLRPEDHFFAHMLLAKAYRSRDLWAACIVMADFYNANGRAEQIVRARRLYGVARRSFAAVSRGEAAPNADLTIRTFYCADGRTFTGTRIALGAAESIPSSNINRLISGLCKEAKGWSLTPVDPEERALRLKARSSANGRKLKGFVRDAKVYHFYNIESGNSVFATQTGMRNLFGMTANKVSALILGTVLSSSGWCFPESLELIRQRKWRARKYQMAGLHGEEARA